MKFDKKLAAVLAVCIIALLILGFVASGQGQPNLPQNGGTAGQPNQPQNGGTAGNLPQNGSATLANPASVFCVEHGGTIKIVTAADGSQSGLCVFPDGSQCEEWAYFRGECSPGSPAARGNVTGGVKDQTPGEITPGTVQIPLKNLTNDTIIPPPPPPPPPPMNVSSLLESDFMVVDDSLPNLLTNQKPVEMPPPPENKTG